MTRVYKPFLHVYVVWHPDFNVSGTIGAALAERLYREFCCDPDKPMATAIGIPFLFRTSPAKGSPPPSIDLESAERTIVVVLVDHEMVLDEVYSRYTTELVSRAESGRHLVLAFNFGKGFLPLGKMQQIGLASEKDPIATLRLKFAAEACRLLRHERRVDGTGTALSMEKPRLFISHAKRDAEDKALEVKALVETLPIDTFFDRVDIAAGYDFTDEIRNNIKQSAVLAWQSDEYGSRPWCNIELLTAKEHQRPIVVVLGVKSGEERSFPYLGNVRTIVATETNSIEIIIAAVREYLRKMYVDGHFQTLTEAGWIPPARFHLFRPPEPIDGALLKRAVNETTPEHRDARPATAPAIVMYPDPPLSLIEAGTLGRLFPDLEFVTPSTADDRPLAGLQVALSISDSGELTAEGLSPVHLQAAMVEMARHVLARGGRIMYGGDLRSRADYGFTRQLFQIVHAYKDLDRPPVELIRNYLAQHIAAELPREEEATLLGLAEFVKPVLRPLLSHFGLQSESVVPDDTADHRYVRARSLTVMRERMVADTEARIFLGGRVSGHQGKYPGILEEAALSLGRMPMFLIGAFGGCTRLIIRMLRDKERPEAFTETFQRVTTRMSQWRNAQGQAESVSAGHLFDTYATYTGQSFDDGPIDYVSIVDRFVAADIGTLENGLSEDENRELFSTTDLDRTIALVIKGLRQTRT